ncbi:hypothetical protein GGTG_03976 [Gaeumannomyces tritici R3-111a-1]|uniref:Uncharacterized protein n=1 Tax=Gaeumannomyces tritici (strain R3-111a-1) TaxID=644352 RepID=J3NRS6_GAET3|nr:hypothetical protein GGTG_03976 [Gaeumannomyces tritici R3-111a-1]EJT78882.1 hypothetical protein GGTG_03976 [Gaeumannomyces tritici R3-111a-1]
MDRWKKGGRVAVTALMAVATRPSILGRNIEPFAVVQIIHKVNPPCNVSGALFWDRRTRADERKTAAGVHERQAELTPTGDADM